jgi:hypothetical protein
MSDRRDKSKKSRGDILTRLMLRFSTSKRIDGLWIGSIQDKPETGLRRVEGALNLIKAHDPQRYGRVIRDLERVWVTLIAGGRAQFDPSTWTCELDERYVCDDTTTTEQIASSIVHEATHARLYRRGIGYEEALRPRVEATCIQRERAFAARLPRGEQMREQADLKLAAYAGPEFWTDDAFRARYDAGATKALQYLGMPKWLPGIVRSINAFRLRLAGAGKS